MQTKSLYTELESKLHQFLIQHCPTSVDSAPFLYASLPAGKLFRPLLACAIANDINNGPVENNLFNFAIALELHHTYTLIHDDLPCMDDDDIRRGRPSTHKKFNEWIAILTGDGLLNLSYRALAEIDHPSLSSLIKFFSWALGPKGLIQGQVFDLSEDCQKSFTRLLRMHELKTGRLLQVAILGATLLSNEPDTIPLKETKNLLRLGS
ncbi:MAG: geranylgeranyl pyrophosphate synthase, partial [Thermoproteota archaeon]